MYRGRFGSSSSGKDLFRAAAAEAPAESAASTSGAHMRSSSSGSVTDTHTAAGRHRKRIMQLEAKLQHYMDCEDRRVKELTEGVLYEFLPAALNVMLPHCEDPLQELDTERCRVKLQSDAIMVACKPGHLVSGVTSHLMEWPN